MSKEFPQLPTQRELSDEAVWAVLEQFDQPMPGDSQGRTYWEASKDVLPVVNELLAQQDIVE